MLSLAYVTSEFHTIALFVIVNIKNSLYRICSYVYN